MSRFQIKDGRSQPWCRQEKAVNRFIRQSFKRKEIATALALYVSLTEVASNRQRDDYNVRRDVLADMIGRSTDSVDRYLSQFQELKIINKEPVVYDNWYRCISIELLDAPEAALKSKDDHEVSEEGSEEEPDPSEERSVLSEERSVPSAPMQGVAEPTRPPNKDHVSEPMQGGSRTHSATPPHPFGNDLEESHKDRILKPRTATAAPPLNSPSADAENSDRAQRNGRGDGQVNAPAKKKGAKRLQSDEAADYTSLGSPGSGADLEETQQGRKKVKKPRKIRGGDPDKDPEKWDAYDALAHFKRKWGKTFPGEIMPERKAHIPKQVNGRIAWLQIEKHPVSAMKRVIDHIFDNWQDGLADKIKWDGSRPAYGIIASTWYFEKVFRLVEYGPTGKPRHDAYDAEAAKRAEEADDGWRK